MRSFWFSTPFAAAALTSASLFIGPAQAASYPTKQIEMIVAFAAGGGTDLLARTLSDALKNHLSQPVGVVNKPGGSGAIGFSEVAASRPDGYKICMGTVEMVTLPPLGMVQFKVSDFKAIARLNAEPAAITVKSDAPWNTIEEFLEYAKANPSKIRIGNSGTGAIWHLASAALEDKANVKFTHVPYDGAAPAVTALLGGHIEAVAVSPGEVINHVKSGAFKTLAVMADQRAKGFDDVPTLKEKGIDLSIGTWRGIVAPQKLPEPIVQALEEAVKNASNETAFQETLERMNMTYAYLDSAAFEKDMNDQAAYFDELIGKLGLKQK